MQITAAELQRLTQKYNPVKTVVINIYTNESQKFYSRGLVFTNRGDTTVLINGKELKQDESEEIWMNDNDLDTTNYQFNFDTTTGSTQNVEVRVIRPSNWD